MVSITEMFYSIQGEGPRLEPSVFIRSSLCNFTCVGFGGTLEAPDGTTVLGCDSIRSVSPKFKSKWFQYINYEDLVNDVDNIIPTYSKHNILKPGIVWTGGEPLIHWNDDVMQRTLSHYMSQGHHITIETNAAISIEFKRKFQEDIMFSMSVKLSNSGEPEHKRINIDNITNIVEHCPSSYLKFVVSEKTWDSDWEEIKSILKRIPVFVQVYLMPMADNKVDLDSNCTFVIEKCAELGFNYSDRCHIRAWDMKEAV